MIKEIAKPESNTYLLNLPDEMIGKVIEISAEEIQEHKVPFFKKSIDQLHKELEGLTVNLESFKFNRSEANDYE
ncbi:MAG: hypothetical protein EOP42_28030 [Sphingobacteriaceae bacterium]|nr:MAG: hypothetical protein EOP42_28030 [Sphingobacteriaceae bacterium]